MISKNEILKSLEAFKSARGKPVIVHTSLKAIGEIEGGAKTLFSCLIEFFTSQNGLLCIPTHTWESGVLDLRKSESCIGVLPCIAAEHKDAVRTLHPTHSMAVFGDKQRAIDFCKGEEKVDTPTSPDGCYGKIYREGGYVLLIGVGQEKNTFLHCVEEMLGVSKRLTKEKLDFTIIHKDGEREVRPLYWFRDDEIEDVSVNFGKFEAAFRHYNAIIDGKIGNAAVQFCSATKMKEVLELIYKRSDGKELLADCLPLDEKLYK